MAQPNKSLKSKNNYINCGGKLISLEKPAVMGILNTTSDSFYDGGKHNSLDGALKQSHNLLEQGAAIIDIGGQSTRPGAKLIGEKDEFKSVVPAIEAIIKEFPAAVISIDTFYSAVAKGAVEAGASIVNDISAGDFDPNMIKTVAELNVPYIAMHKKGEPGNMQKDPQYDNVLVDVLEYLLGKVYQCREAGISDVIIDPGFGFGKNSHHNFYLLAHLDYFNKIGVPLLVGLSRKSMAWKNLNSSPAEALNGTTVLHTMALERGADILRVHDPKEALEAIQLVDLMFQNS
jgi:dihydropteroate synthase